MSFSNAQLAQKISDLIDYWSSFSVEYADWLGGTVSGGPNSDGEYPLTDYTGTETLVKSPAKLQDDVDNITTGATAQANAAAASAAAALTSENNAATSEANALSHANDADADRIAAATSETNATNAAVTSTAQANLATDRAGYASEWANAPFQTLISSAAGGDQVDDYSALHWATVAEGFAGSIDSNLYGQLAQNEDVTGTWRILTDAVNDDGLKFRNNNCTITIGNAGYEWSIKQGQPGNYDGYLLFHDTTTSGPKMYMSPGTNGSVGFDANLLVVDGNRIASNTSSSLAFLMPFDSTRMRMSFRGPNPGDAEYRIESYTYGGSGLQGNNVALFKTDQTTYDSTFQVYGGVIVDDYLTIGTQADFTPIAAPAHTEGRVYYDSTEKALSYYNDEADVTINLGQENVVRVRNTTGVTITNGSVVYISGATGANLPNVSLAQADALATAEALGVVTHDIENNSNGYVTTLGVVRDLNTSSYTAGDELFLSTSVAGGLTNVKPTTGYAIPIGYVTVVNVSVGEIKVTMHGEPVSQSDQANWNTAYGWGDHAGLYSLTSHNHAGVYEPADATILKDADIGVTVHPALTDTLTLESSAGDASLYLKADTSNTVESSNPFIRMEQDGNAVQGIIGLSGADNVDAQGTAMTGAGNNSLVIHIPYSSGEINLGVGGATGLTITNTDQILGGSTWGTAGLPTFSSAVDANTGMYVSASDTLGFSTGGIERVKINSSGLTLVAAGADLILGNNSLTADNISGSAGAAPLKIGTGTGTPMVWGQYCALGRTYSAARTGLANNAYIDSDDTVSGQWRHLVTHGSYGHTILEMAAGAYYFYGATNSVTSGAIVSKNQIAQLDSTNGFKVAGTANGNPGVGWSSLSKDMLHLDGKEVIDGNDTWLRINQNGDFSNGCYLPNAWSFNSTMKRYNKGAYLFHQSSSYNASGAGGITFSTSAASGGVSGDIWFQYT